MEGDLLWLDLAILYVHLVAAQHDRDVFTHAARRGSNLLLHGSGMMPDMQDRILAVHQKLQIQYRMLHP